MGGYYFISTCSMALPSVSIVWKGASALIHAYQQRQQQTRWLQSPRGRWCGPTWRPPAARWSLIGWFLGSCHHRTCQSGTNSRSHHRRWWVNHTRSCRLTPGGNRWSSAGIQKVKGQYKNWPGWWNRKEEWWARRMQRDRNPVRRKGAGQGMVLYP